ncbi:MAG: class I SAM-dependent methyltransferase [Rhizobiaceae bacterium]
MNQNSAPEYSFNTDAAGAFLDRISMMLNDSAVIIMLSVGHRLKLFDTLADLPPGTCEEIAEAANLNKRYIREWLAVMVTGGVINYNAPTKTYDFPPEHAACLTTSGQFGNLAVYSQFAALAGSMQEQLIEVFRSGEGIPYSNYPCFHQIMSEDSDQTVVGNLLETIEMLSPELIQRLEIGIDVLDAGCGAGHAVIRLAELFPKSRITGIDLCEDAITMAETETCNRGVTNVLFQASDLTYYEEVEKFDLVTSFDAVHDMKNPQGMLMTINKALRQGGIHIMQDIGGSAHLENNLKFPFASFLYAISCVHCTPVSLAQGGKGLGAMWGWETAQSMLESAGFADISKTVLPHDPMNVWFVSQKNNQTPDRMREV